MHTDQHYCFVTCDDISAALDEAQFQIETVKSRLNRQAVFYPERKRDQDALRSLRVLAYRLRMLREALQVDEPPGRYLH